MQTYLVGRKNARLPCDIELPESESSVSRRHLELSLTDDGRFYVVHLHPRNVTMVLRNGVWQTITQDYVDVDEPLKLGAFETSARKLLDRAWAGAKGGDFPGAGSGSSRDKNAMQWDPERGTFARPRH